MTDPSSTPRLVVKQTAGWFAAGDSFRRALNVLSDGAFKLFAFLCLEADRRSGKYKATQNGLATTLGKSRRVIGTYVAELQAKRICGIEPGKNQFAPTVFTISDSYWPYQLCRRVFGASRARSICGCGSRSLSVTGMCDW